MNLAFAATMIGPRYLPDSIVARKVSASAFLHSQGRVGMWRGGGRIGLSVSAPFVWRCLNSRANYSVPTPRSSNRTCATNASGSRTRHHAFAHGRSRAAIRPTARAVEPQRPPIDSIARQPPMPPVPSENPVRRRNSRVWPNRGKVRACVMPYDFCP